MEAKIANNNTVILASIIKRINTQTLEQIFYLDATKIDLTSST